MHFLVVEPVKALSKYVHAPGVQSHDAIINWYDRKHAIIHASRELWGVTLDGLSLLLTLNVSMFLIRLRGFICLEATCT